MRIHLVAVVTAVLIVWSVPPLCGQSITRTAFPLQGYILNVAVTGTQDGALVHGSAETPFAPLAGDPYNRRYGAVFPFLFECNSAGTVDAVYVLPDTGQNESSIYTTNRVQMRTAALRDGDGRIMVAWSRQQVFWDDIGGPDYWAPTVSIGVIENGVFRLIVRREGEAEPQLLRDATGTVHLVTVLQRSSGSASMHYVNYAGEIIHQSFRDGSVLSEPEHIAKGLKASLALDPAGRLHIAAVDFDTLPSRRTRITERMLDQGVWSPSRTMAEMPIQIRRWEVVSIVDLLPDVHAFAATSDGTARIVVSPSEILTVMSHASDAILAFSSEGKSAVIDSTGGRNLRGISSSIHASGVISCAFDAWRPSSHTQPMKDSLYFCSIDADMNVMRNTLLAADTLAFGNVRLLESSRDGLGLLYTKLDSAWMILAPGADATRRTRPIIDGFGALLSSHPTAADASGALWVAYRGASMDAAPAWLLRIPPLTEGAPAHPATLTLQAFPNPATKDATLRFQLPAEQSVIITVHDLLGREVRRVADWPVVAAGTYTLALHLDGLAVGSYFVHLRGSGGEAQVAIGVR